MNSVPHKTFEDLHQRAVTSCSDKNESLQSNFQRTFSRLEVMVYNNLKPGKEVMVYNNLKPGKHIFRSSNGVYFISRQNFEKSLTVVHISTVQGRTPLYLDIFRTGWACKIKQIFKPFKTHSQISKSVFPVNITNFFDSFSHSARLFKRLQKVD